MTKTNQPRILIRHRLPSQFGINHFDD